MNDLISIIVPIYNIEKYLKKCVDSIINQTYANIEIILVNDGSTDGSLAICQEYEKKDTRIVVVNKKNGGLSDARNYGIKECRGKYIATVDGDDFISNTYIENLYNLIIKYNADISSTNRYDFIVKEADELVQKPDYYNSIEDIKVFDTDAYLNEIFSDKLPHEAWGKLYRRSIFDNILYKKGLSVFEDLECLVRILENKELKIVCDMNVYDYYYRKRDNSIMKSKYNVNWRKELQFYFELVNNPKYEKYKNNLKKIFAAITVRNCIKISIDKIEYDEFKENVKYIKTLKIYNVPGVKSKIFFILYKFFPKMTYSFASTNILANMIKKYM